jgi:hypothetical protein
MNDEPWERDLQAKANLYREMERDVTDPLALGLLHEIVSELEATLQRGPSAGGSVPPAERPRRLR